MISLKLNQQEVKAKPTQTIYELAKAEGITIPTLCHLPRASSRSVCRICVVEVKGVRGLLPACSTLVAENMEVLTHSETVLRSRRVLLEFILAEHRGLQDDDVVLGDLCSELGVDDARFILPYKSRSQCEKVDSEYLKLDLSRCILCDRCIRACDKREVITRAGFGQDTRIVFDNDLSIDESACIRCGDCVEACPVGAIVKK